VGRGAKGCCGSRGSFYRARGREGRRCSEGNGRWRRCAFKAFNPSVTGGERRGEWGVKVEGKCGAVSGRGGVIGVAGARREGGGGGGGARSGFQRKKTVGLTDRVGPPISVGEATGGLGQKGGRRWAAAGLEKKGGAGPKPLLGLKFKRVKENSILIDFWIKIGLEIE
jgi:hypothetical protein